MPCPRTGDALCDRCPLPRGPECIMNGAAGGRRGISVYIGPIGVIVICIMGMGMDIGIMGEAMGIMGVDMGSGGTGGTIHMFGCAPGG